MFKKILFLGLVALALPAWSCQEPSDKFLYNFLNYKTPPSVWRTVRRNSYEADRVFRAVGVVQRYLEDSYGYLGGTRYNYIDHENKIQICQLSSNKIRVTHRDFGSGTIERRGSGDESLLIGKSGIFTVYARPDHLVEK